MAGESQFGGVAVTDDEQPAVSQFGGVPVEDTVPVNTSANQQLSPVSGAIIGALPGVAAEAKHLTPKLLRSGVGMVGQAFGFNPNATQAGTFTAPPPPQPSAAPQAAPQSSGPTENWARAEHSGEFYGGRDYGEADKYAKEAKEFNARNTGFIVPEGGERIAVPREELERRAAEQARAAEDARIRMEAEQRAREYIAQKEAERAATETKPKPVSERAEKIAGSPITRGALVGANAIEAYNRANEPGIRNKIAAGLNALAAASAVAPGAVKKIPYVGKVAPLVSPALTGLAHFVAEEPEQKAAGGSIVKKLAGPLTLGALSIPQISDAAEQLKKGNVGEAAGTAADIGSMFLPNPLMALYMGLSPAELGDSSLRHYNTEPYQEGETGLLKGSRLPRYAPGGSVAKKVLEEAKPLFEKFKYDRYKIAQDYPEVIPPVLTTDPKTGKEFLQKQLGPDALEVQKARKEAQKQINAGNYEPFFDINQRYYADPSHYPTAGYTQTDIVPKKAETIAKYTELANDPESLARLRGAFEKAKDRPAAKDWYAMGQLEDAFIKELGPEEGRKQFKNRFADAMAATTGGADPNSNLMMAAYTNYQKALGREIPTKAADLPFPIGGRFVSGNMEQAKKLADIGEIPVTNPKRHNFSANFLGHRDVSTLDEQMSQLWDPKMMSPPPNAYGIYQAALAKEAEKAGVQPANFQDIAWAGAKDYPGKPMMQEINEMLGRTHLITGEPQEEILKGFIRGNKPMYGIGAIGAGAATQDEEMPHMAPGGEVLSLAKKFVLPAAENAARTQIIGTLPTYAKAAEILANRGATGQAIDFGAGLGKGAAALGEGTHTYEPFAKDWSPTFTKPEDIPTDAYGRLTNLNVLNVVPREARDEIVQHIGRVMEPGGLGILTTRGADVMGAKGVAGPEPMSIITSRDTYQKGFTKQELEDYMKYMLGDKFDVNKLNLGPAGVLIQKKAAGGEILKKLLPLAEREANKAKFLENSAVKDVMYHGTFKDFNAFDKNKRELGFHLGNPNQASYIIEDAAKNPFFGSTGANVMPVHASIKKPYEAQTDLGDWSSVQNWKNYLKQWELEDSGILNLSKKDIDSLRTEDDIRNLFTKKGYDSIEYPNHMESASPDTHLTGDYDKSYMVFEPTQIKSAIGNEGTFDPTNPDITKKRGGLV